MTVEWYDLAQRLHAGRSGAPVPRLVHAPIPRPRHPVAVRAHRSGDAVIITACGPDLHAETARDAAALDLLATLGVRITAPTWQCLVTDDARTLPALRHLARSAGRTGGPADVAAHLAWWCDRADYPGTSAVVPLLAVCRSRWVTGSAPDDERHPATWREWLAVPDDGCPGLLGLLDRTLVGLPLPLLDWITNDDAWSWNHAQSEHADGWDWRRPDTTSRAAVGLRSRCDAADVYAAALLDDPLYRRRAVHTGHVVTGVAEPVPGRGAATVTCDRMDARLRAGTSVLGWTGAPHDRATEAFAATVTATGVTAGRLVLSLTGVTSGRQPTGPTLVTLREAPPSPHRITAGRRRYQALYGTRTSWLSTGRTPTPHRRDVPLDVLVAAADD